ncbi:hypothetical protein Tco_0953694 [Tanacetum coccineum]|uniref:Uncharacterized protein n=1 Tax=Tanacetum coccineum TaxID=301880 RepID=A0ABQ5E490_9ASTR
MEEASLHTTRKHLCITTYYYDKHGVPPTKRLFKVAMLDPAIWKNLGYSEWSTPAGLKLARENLQSRVKEEDSITDVENAVFDLGVMDSLCFLFIDQRVFISMITKFIKFVELNFSMITRGFDIKVCMLKGLVSFVLQLNRQMTCLSIYKLVRSAPDGCFVSCTEGPESVIQFVRPRGTIFAHGPFKNSFQATIGYLNLPTCLWVIRGGETMSDSVFKHDLCKLVIAKMGSAITYDCTRGTESGEERFEKFANNSGVVGGERFRFNPFR